MLTGGNEETKDTTEKVVVEVTSAKENKDNETKNLK
jgi:hypothetical protein